MTIELLRTLSIVGYVLAGIFLVLSIVLFFVLDIPKVYGDISGRTARKAIAEIEKKSRQESSVSSVEPSKKSKTDKITGSGRIVPATEELEPTSTTQKLQVETTVLKAPETTVLGANQESLNTTNEKVLTLDVEFFFFSSDEIIV